MPYKLKIDGVDQDLVFDTTTLLNTEAIAWQKVSDRLPADVIRGFQNGDAEALTLVVWICRRRAGETNLKYSDVVFDMAKSSMSYEAEDGEQDQADGEGEQGSDPPSPESAPAKPRSKRKPSSTSPGSPSS